VRRHLLALAAALTVALLAVGAGRVTAAAPAPAEAGAQVRDALFAAQQDLVLDGGGAAAARVGEAERDLAPLAAELGPVAPAALADARAALARADRAARAGDGPALGAARADVWAALLRGAALAAQEATSAGDAAAADRWLGLREFRRPTRFSAAPADATEALGALRAGRLRPAAAREAVARDLLDAYGARMREALAGAEEARGRGFRARWAEQAAAARGYFRILAPRFRARRGAAAADEAERTFGALAASALAGDRAAFGAARTRAEAELAGFRAVPLAPEEATRRAGQLLHFLQLVPVEYGRGVEAGRVTHDFEVQEAITFRDGAEGAFTDLQDALARRDPAATRRAAAALATLRTDLADAIEGRRVADADAVKGAAQGALDDLDGAYPDEWRGGSAGADIDVVRVTLDRLQAAVRAGRYGSAESARLEAYAVFEFGPEIRLRALAPDLVNEAEGLLWYGAAGHEGMATLVAERAGPEAVADTRTALDSALDEVEVRLGSGASTGSIITNAAVLVFREGLEAVLILAAITASMLGANRRLRRPIMLGALGALAASAVTYWIAVEMIGQLAGFGEKLEAVVSLVAIAVLLLITNWFFHKVYWTGWISQFHGRRRRILSGAAGGFLAAQTVGLLLLGFSSVYREGFETVLFLQALQLEAGSWTVLQGVALGLAGVLGVGWLMFVVQRRLPYKKMLIWTGVMIGFVLVVMVGTTARVMQGVGWLPITPIPGLELPYWAGVWLGLNPTWEGILSQAGAIVFVAGSYVLAERIRGRRRSGSAAAPPAVREAAEVEAREPSHIS
jgi:high-affinity iron transporter